MRIPKQQIVFRKNVLALSVLLCFNAAAYAEDDVEALTKPESSIGLGAGVSSGSSQTRSIFDQYNGLRKNSTNLLLDASVIKLQEETGLWTRLEGRNLGLDNREASFSQNKQGDWKYAFEYNEINHQEIRTINTGLQGAGTTTPVVNRVALGKGADLNLQLQRKAASVSAEKWINSSLLFEASFKDEEKKGARMSGTGIYCSSITGLSRYTCSNNASLSGALFLLPEPVDNHIKQLEAKLNFTGDNFLLTGGYYGSMFNNSNRMMQAGITGGLYGTDGITLISNASVLSYLTSPVALAPDNQAHQYYVSGNYAFNTTTRTTFKYAHTHATQDQDYSSFGVAGNLGGVVDTTLAQLGLTARPVDKLNVVANVRYEDKNDKTPEVAYNRLSNGTTAYSSNYSNSATKLNGKLEGSYQLPDHFRGTLGIDYATVERAVPPSVASLAAQDLTLALGGLREKTRETSYRAELQRGLSETLNGSASLVHSRRSGDQWTLYNATGTLPQLMLDRTRDKARLAADWSPTSELSIQFNVEDGKDSFDTPQGGGMRDAKMNSFGVDAALIVSDNLKLTGYLNRSEQKLNVNNTNVYLTEIKNTNISVSVGAVGKVAGNIDVGGNVTYLEDNNRYTQSTLNGSSIVGAQLPEVTYRTTTLKLYGKYALQKTADIRVDLVHQNASLNEWTWGSNGTPFNYSDNTTVTVRPNQSMSFLGASYVYKFR